MREKRKETIKHYQRVLQLGRDVFVFLVPQKLPMGKFRISSLCLSLIYINIYNLQHFF